MKKPIILTLLVVFGSCFYLQAQTTYETVRQHDNDQYQSAHPPVPTKQGFQKDKLFVGGNLGLSFGNITYINISPTIGYRFSDLFTGGVQINGQFESVKYKDFNNVTVRKENYTMVGGGVYGRLYPIREFFIQAQPEINFLFGKERFLDQEGHPSSKFNDQVFSFLAGAGYAQPIGGNSAFVIMILYDLAQNERSPYGNNAIFRAGVNIGF